MTNPIPEEALSNHIAVLGKTGSGKTYAAKGIAERLLGMKRQVCVLDPTGAWWGLRLGANGKAAGYDVVLLGGKHGDIPLSPLSGAAVARLVTQQHASVVLDTSGMTVGEYTQWFIDFAGTLYTTIREPLHLIIDEAHYFMPQSRTLDVQGGKMLHAGNRLMSGGRVLGIRGVMITQRPAKLHKDSLTCADTLIAMRMLAPQDRDAVKDWVDGCGDPAQGKEVIASLAQLERGEGWVWFPPSPPRRVKFPAIATYDSSATPKHGAKAAPKVAEIRLDEVRAAMADAVKEAEANDPKRLKAEVARLTREMQALAAKKTAPVAAMKGPDKAAIEKMVRVAVAAERAHLSKLAGGMLSRRAAELAILVRAINGDIAFFAGKTLLKRPITLPAVPIVAAAHPVPVAREAKASLGLAPDAQAGAQSEPSDRAGLAGPERRILDAIAEINSIGVDRPLRTQVALFARYSPTSTSFTNPLGALRSKGLITYPDSDAVLLTEQGRRIASSAEAPTSLADLHGRVLGILDGPRQRILRPLLAAYPDALSREKSAEAAAYSHTSTSYTNPLGSLRSLGLVDYPNSAEVVATAVLFPEGLVP